MWIERQSFSIPIKNYEIESNKFRKHGKLFGGASKRGIICGPSGCGKTSTIIALLTSKNGIRFENIYVYSKSLYQKSYEFLRALLNSIKEIDYFETSIEKDIIPPTDIKPNSIIVFDDVICTNQSIMRDFYCFSRHLNTDCFYLSQTYSSIPKQLIRDNTNLLILFKQDNTNLKHIYDDHVSSDMSFQRFKELCGMCWQRDHDFVVIDKDCDLNSGRYRKKFENFIHI